MGYLLSLAFVVLCAAPLRAGPKAAEPESVARLDRAARLSRLPSDLKAAAVYRAGLAAAVAFQDARPGLFPPARLDAPRLLTREQKEPVWQAWRSFLDYLLALDALQRFHRTFYELKGSEREDSFLAYYAAFLAQYRWAMAFIERAERDPAFDTLLNEPVPELGLSAKAYARLKYRFLHVGRATEFAALEAVYKGLGGSRAAELRAALREDADAVWKAGWGKGEVLTAKNGLNILKKAGLGAVFPVQAGVSEWMGDTKVWRKGRSLIQPDQIDALQKRLEPGDVLLERREWYLSNVGLPGWWPHAALYIGTPEERRAYFGDAEVRAWLKAAGRPDGDLEALLRERYPAAYARSQAPESGHAPRVLEAISEGVSFTSLEHSADADSVAALRPRLPRAERAAAILRAFHYAGRPYDFDFDFLTDASLVCTELVYKAYEPRSGVQGLRLPLVELMGRQVTPANEVARQFDEAYGKPGAQFDLVAFLDGHERSGRAAEPGLEAFRASWRRPKWHILAQDLPE